MLGVCSDGRDEYPNSCVYVLRDQNIVFDVRKCKNASNTQIRVPKVPVVMWEHLYMSKRFHICKYGLPTRRNKNCHLFVCKHVM